MTGTTSFGKIIVGIDGSKEALSALRWAVDEARHRGATVEALHVWHFVYMGDPMGISAVASMGDVEASAKLVVEEALAEAGAAGAEVGLTGRAIEGAASKVLIEEAAEADLLVVGRRGRGGFLGLLLGSVAQQLAHHAPCPLVIVPAET
jgi:nucleotide-binding universal stress UspA family protein